MTIALLGIALSLALLITLAYRGHSVIAVAPFAASIAVIMSGAPLLASYTQIFMPAHWGPSSSPSSRSSSPARSSVA